MTPRAAWLTTLTLITAMVTYVIALPGSELVLLLIPITVGVRYFAYQRTAPLAPQWVVAICTFVAVFYAAYRVLQEGPKIEVLAEFVAVLAVLKSLERWSPRDDLQMLLVAIFLVLASIISSSMLIVGFMLVLFVPLLCYTAMALQIEGALSFGIGDKYEPVVRDTFERAARRGTILGVFAAAFSLIFMISIIAFVLLPRGIGDNTISGFSRPVMGRATGFRNTVELGRGGLISDDPTIVMEVEIRDPRTDHSLGANGRVFHLRGTALNTYENGRWDRTPLERDFTSRQAGSRFNFTDFIGDQQNHAGEADLKQVIYLTPGASNGGILFTVWRPIRIDFAQHQPGTLVVDNDQRTASLEDSKSKLTNYEVLSRVGAVAMPELSARLTPPASFESETITSITENVLSGAGIETEYKERPVNADHLAAAEIERWLAETGGFAYTLDVESAAADEDPIEWFLTDSKLGHCEYFASAMAAMCRTVGINSRVVTGYLLGEYDPASERYIVRRSNAHAWVEVETYPGNWVTFDPTPNITGLHVPEAGKLRLLRKFMDAIDGFWLSSVVSYDESNQMKLLGLEHIGQVDPFQDRQLMTRGKRILRVVFVLLIAGLAGLFLYRWYRKPGPIRVGSIVLELPEAALDARRKLLAHWARLGRPRPHWAGLVAHAAHPSERELAEMLTSAAFGRRAWAASDSARASEILDTLSSVEADNEPVNKSENP